MRREQSKVDSRNNEKRKFIGSTHRLFSLSRLIELGKEAVFFWTPGLARLPLIYMFIHLHSIAEWLMDFSILTLNGFLHWILSECISFVSFFKIVWLDRVLEIFPKMRISTNVFFNDLWNCQFCQKFNWMCRKILSLRKTNIFCPTLQKLITQRRGL